MSLKDVAYDISCEILYGSKQDAIKLFANAAGVYGLEHVYEEVKEHHWLSSTDITLLDNNVKLVHGQVAVRDGDAWITQDGKRWFFCASEHCKGLLWTRDHQTQCNYRKVEK